VLELEIVIVGGRDAPRVADRLAAEDVPVILGRATREPRRSFEPYDASYSVAARLHEAGVTFCFSYDSASSLRNLPYEAGMAAAFGLPREEALKGVTLYPAEILGVGSRLGSLEEGKDANLIVTTGDPLEIRTQVVRAFIGGREVDLSSRHTRLYERYRNRPRTDGEESRLEPSPAGR
jgi:imidazolonepropionase-like amidohydrolase